MMKSFVHPARALTAVASLILAASAGPCAAADTTPAVLDQIAAANRLAGDDLKTPLFLCRADSGAVVRQALEQGSGRWIPPTRVFDNLFYIGNRFVGVLVVKTSAGLILFDSSSSRAEAEQHLVPGLIALGLDPKAIRCVIVTHGHWDHFGGAAWLQKTYGARIGLSRADWDMIGREPADSPGIGGHVAPTRDLIVEDGQALTLGDTTIRLYVTPGHTPGPVSAILPGQDGGRTHVVSLLGSVAFPPSLEPTPTTGGLLAYDRSVERFAQISREAGADAIFNTHVFADGGLDRLAAAQARTSGAPNPFVIGSDAVARYYGLFDACLKAAIARPHEAADAGKPTVPPR